VLGITILKSKLNNNIAYQLHSNANLIVYLKIDWLKRHYTNK